MILYSIVKNLVIVTLQWDHSCKISVFRTLGEVRVECPLLSQPCHKDEDCVFACTHARARVTSVAPFRIQSTQSCDVLKKSAEILTFLTTYTYKATLLCKPPSPESCILCVWKMFNWRGSSLAFLLLEDHLKSLFEETVWMFFTALISGATKSGLGGVFLRKGSGAQLLQCLS